ncbi:MAG: hypothetical protein ACI8Y7_001093, partial [Candidatus Woesearchaeota archaeon]
MMVIFKYLSIHTDYRQKILYNFKLTTLLTPACCSIDTPYNVFAE